MHWPGPAAPSTSQLQQLITRNLSCERILCEGKHPRLTRSQPLNDNDWDIVRSISSHVRRLIDDDVHPWFSVLTPPPDQSFLFPNLHSLSFGAPLKYRRASNTEDIRAAFQLIARFFHLILGSCLFTLRFDIPVDPKIQWGGYSIPDETVNLFSRVVSELGDLEMFRSDAISWDLLSSLAHAKALQRLWIYLLRWLGPAAAFSRNFVLSISEPTPLHRVPAFSAGLPSLRSLRYLPAVQHPKMMTMFRKH